MTKYNSYRSHAARDRVKWAVVTVVLCIVVLALIAGAVYLISPCAYGHKYVEGNCAECGQQQSMVEDDAGKTEPEEQIKQEGETNNEQLQ